MLLALAVLRHWRRARRFTDGTWLIAAVCLGAPRLVWPGEAGFLPAAPFVALLAGSAWDAARAPRLRRAATAAVVAHVLIAVLQGLPDRSPARISRPGNGSGSRLWLPGARSAPPGPPAEAPDRHGGLSLPIGGLSLASWGSWLPNEFQVWE